MKSSRINISIGLFNNFLLIFKEFDTRGALMPDYRGDTKIDIL